MIIQTKYNQAIASLQHPNFSSLQDITFTLTNVDFDFSNPNTIDISVIIPSNNLLDLSKEMLIMRDSIIESFMCSFDPDHTESIIISGIDGVCYSSNIDETDTFEVNFVIQFESLVVLDKLTTVPSDMKDYVKHNLLRERYMLIHS